MAIDESGALPAEIIRCSDYHKSYGETIAVSGLSFAVERGQILGLLGPNGAGKTTTLRAIAGIIPPTRGQLTIAGHDVVTDSVAAKKRMAYVPDDPKLFDSLTVWEHLDFVAALYQVPDYESRGVELLEHFELTEKRNTVCQELSRGMRQKVAIACAYLYQPVALLFDEPLTGLDPRAIRRLKASIQERAGQGAAVVVSSHLLSMVEDICTHLLILARGKAAYCGPIELAREHFADLQHDASLEEVFMRATEANESPAGYSSSEEAE